MNRTRIGIVALMIGALMVVGCRKQPQPAEISDTQLVDSPDGKGKSLHFSITFNGGPTYDSYVPVEICMHSESFQYSYTCMPWDEAVGYATTSGLSATEPPPEGSPVTFEIPLAGYLPDPIPAGSGDMPLEVYATWEYEEITGFDDRATISLSPWLDDGARGHIVSASVNEGTGGAYMTVEFQIDGLSTANPDARPTLMMDGQAITGRFDIPWADIAQRDSLEESTATNVPLGVPMTINFPIESYLHQTVSVYEGSSITADLTLLIDGREHGRSVLNFDSLYSF